MDSFMENETIKILAIDDIPDNLFTLKAVLSDTLPGVNVITALDGVSGMDLARTQDPDVILLDIIMPGMDGYAVCRQLKADKDMQIIPVVFLTALKTSRESRIQALEAGAEGFLYKPIDEPELIAQVRAMVKIKAANKQSRKEKEQLTEQVALRTRELEQELAEGKKADAELRRVHQGLVQGQRSTLNLLEDLKEEIEIRKMSEKALRASEAALQKAQRVAHLGSWVWHIPENRLEWSDEMFRIFGMEKKGFSGNLADVIASAIHPDDRAAVEHVNNSVTLENKPIPLEYRIIWPDGSVRTVWAEAGDIILDRSGKPQTLSGIVQDITERKQAEEQIHQALREKETLLRELYHRTKNNMNVISSMLSLQAEYSQNETVKTVFQETENKISAMALVHQMLYQSQDLSRIDLQEYVSDLAELLISNHRPMSSHIALLLDTEPVTVMLDSAIPCGLVINELFSNMFKHAFPHGRKGEIRVKLSRSADGIICLSLADNGVGVPAGFDFRAQPTLGLQTIFLIVEGQLQGSVKFGYDHGVSCQIQFSDTFYTRRV
jgi:PAS domain S-box-containing protein